jgi:hypothetical protein
MSFIAPEGYYMRKWGPIKGVVLAENRLTVIENVDYNPAHLPDEITVNSHVTSSERERLRGIRRRYENKKAQAQ